MELREAIDTLEAYFSSANQESNNEDMLRLRDKVLQAFRFSEADLEKMFETNPDYAFVKFSGLDYYKMLVCGGVVIKEENVYMSAIVPRMIANIFEDRFKKAVLYRYWWQLDALAQKQGLKDEESYDIKFVSELFSKTREAGYGYIVSNIHQKERPTQIAGESFIDIANDGYQARLFADFEENEVGQVKLRTVFPALDEVFMALASEKFGSLERKRIQPQE